MTGFVITSKKLSKLKFIIGYRYPLNLTSTMNKVLPDEDSRVAQWAEEAKWNENFLNSHDIGFVERTEPERLFELSIKKGKSVQILNPKQLRVDFPSSIHWIGDLDGDEKDDYIIHYGEKSGTTILYLSTVADEGCLLYTSPSPRDRQKSRMPSSA